MSPAATRSAISASTSVREAPVALPWALAPSSAASWKAMIVSMRSLVDPEVDGELHVLRAEEVDEGVDALGPPP